MCGLTDLNVKEFISYLFYIFLLIKFILTYIPDLDPLKIEAVQQKTCQFENKVAYSSTNISIKSIGSKSCYSSTIPKQSNQNSALISPKTLKNYQDINTEAKLNDGSYDRKDSKGSSTSIGIISPLKSPSKEKRSSLTVQQALKKSVNKLKRLNSTPLKNLTPQMQSPLASPNIGEQLDEDPRTFEEKYTIIDSDMLGEGCSSTVKECILNLQTQKPSRLINRFNSSTLLIEKSQEKKTHLTKGISFLKLHQISPKIEEEAESSSRSINSDQNTSPHQFQELDVNERIQTITKSQLKSEMKIQEDSPLENQ